MKNQVLLTLAGSLIIPFLFTFALATSNQHFRQLSDNPDPAMYNTRQMSPRPAAESGESLSGTDEIMDLMIIQNKQINFWIP
jgi:hypothetical protein